MSASNTSAELGSPSAAIDHNVNQLYEEFIDGTGHWFLCKHQECGGLESSELDIIGHLKQHLPQLDSGFVMVSGSGLWSDMYVRHFIDAKELSHDDLLFFVRNAPKKNRRFFSSTYETRIDVLRKCSPNLPVGDPEIDWEESFYLNVIMQKYEYSITCAVCTRTSPKELQILRKFSQKVFASPSRRSMDCKGETEQISYPNIFFTVDNYDELLSEILVRDGEMVCVEMLATDRSSAAKRVIFFGSIQYQVLKQVHDARASLSTRISRKTPKPYFQGQQRIEFVKMKGPGGKGIAEMAVAKQKGTCETPTSEPGFSLTDRDFDFDDEMEENDYIQRRMSDPSSNLKDYIRGWHQRRAVKKAISEHEINNCYGNGINEIEAGDVRDELDDSAYDRMWSMRGFRQAYHFWKENKRASSPALHAFITYITLPWHHIVADLFSHRQQSILTFE